jgi:hypothetical protein
MPSDSNVLFPRKNVNSYLSVYLRPIAVCTMRTFRNYVMWELLLSLLRQSIHVVGHFWIEGSRPVIVEMARIYTRRSNSTKRREYSSWHPRANLIFRNQPALTRHGWTSLCVRACRSADSASSASRLVPKAQPRAFIEQTSVTTARQPSQHFGDRCARAVQSRSGCLPLSCGQAA